MPIKSRWTISIPETSIPTYVFGDAKKPISDKLTFIDSTRPDTHFITFSQFRSWSKRVAVGLQKAGLQRGDKVLVFSGNCIFFPVAFMGILMAGGIFTGANPTYVSRELAHQLQDSDAKFLLTTEVSLDVAVDAASQIGMGKDRIFIFNDEIYDGKRTVRNGVEYWDKLVASEAEGERFVWEDPKDPKETLACLNYSSGTTGVAKGVMISHFNHIANAAQTIFFSTLHPEYKQRLPSEKYLAFLP